MTIWFDVDDLVAYFTANRRPSGIQRLCLQVYQEVWAQAGAGGAVRFCRHDLHYTRLVEIEWPVLQSMVVQVSGPADPHPAALISPPGLAIAPPPPRRRASLPVRYLAKRLLRFELRNRMGVAYYYAPSRRAGLSLAARAALLHFGLLKPEPPAPAVKLEAEPEAGLRDGDVLVTLGSIWDPRFFTLLPALRARHRLRFVTMFYDLIPIALPQFTDPSLAALFTNWLETIVPSADLVLTISRASARDLVAAMAARLHAPPNIVILPIGATPPPARPPPSPARRPYVLFVSTIEPRKNHALMLAVWANMLSTMPAAAVPDLVFAGRVIGDIAERLHASIKSPQLRDKFHIVAEPDDEHLHRLYRNCLFTVFPSFYEGWGLPVTESFTFGKVVAASDRGSLPEAGLDFCVYYDPDSLSEATDVIRGLIETPARRIALEARIAAEFRPPSWADTATALLDALRTADTPAVRAMEEVA
jgi:glycosyltransferase involved in cell wall biosynthesis